MARTLSWIDRLVPITRTIAHSARSHYGRKEIQTLFEIQPRSAQKLMAMLPTIRIGRSHLVEKNALIKVLQYLNEAEDPNKAFAVLHAKAAQPLHRNLRTLSLKDTIIDLESPPENLILKTGELTVHFKTVDQLAEALVYLAALLQERIDNFAAQYEPVQVPLENTVNEAQMQVESKYFRRWTTDKSDQSM